MIGIFCIGCGREIAEHAFTFGRCIDGRYHGSILMDMHALDDVPPARRALERARLAQQQHDRRMDVQLSLSSDGAFG